MITTVPKILYSLAEKMDSCLSLPAPVKIAPLNTETGVSVTITGGNTLHRYLDGGKDKRLLLTILVKNKNQMDSIISIFSICDYFEKGEDFPEDEGFIIKDTAVEESPSLSSLSQCGSNFVYSCNVRVDYYERGGEL